MSESYYCTICGLPIANYVGVGGGNLCRGHGGGGIANGAWGSCGGGGCSGSGAYTGEQAVEANALRTRVAELEAVLGDKVDELDAALHARDRIESERDRYRYALDRILCHPRSHGAEMHDIAHEALNPAGDKTSPTQPE